MSLLYQLDSIIYSGILKSRFIARLRRKNPLLYSLLAFLAGQSITLIILNNPILPFILALLVVTAVTNTFILRSLPLWFVTFGSLSAVATSPALPAINFNDVLILKLDKAPRRPRVGEVSFSARIIRQYESNPENTGIRLSGKHVLCKATDLPWRAVSGIKEGSLVVVRGTFKNLLPARSPFSYRSTLYRHGYRLRCKVDFAAVLKTPLPYSISGIRNYIKTAIWQLLGSGERSAFLLSMMIGARDLLSNRTERAFKRAGLAHLLVVSGYHVGVIYFLVLSISAVLLRLLPFIGETISFKQLALFPAYIATLFYTLLCGIQGSALRAFIAVTLYTASKLLDRQVSFFHIVTVTLFILSVLYPGCYFEPGTELTFAALFGIALAQNERSLRLSYIKICLYASLFTAPVTLFWFGQISLAGFILNPILAPLLSFLACSVGTVATTLYLSGIDLHGYALEALTYVLELLKEAVIYLAAFPQAAVYESGSFGFLAILALLLTLIGFLLYHRTLGWRAANGLS